jgi:hypothetical protein
MQSGTSLIHPPADMTTFYRQYKAIKPFLQADAVPADGSESHPTPSSESRTVTDSRSSTFLSAAEHLQTREDRKKLDGMYEVSSVLLDEDESRRLAEEDPSSRTRY